MRYFVALVGGMLAAGAILVIGLQVRSNTNRPTRTIVHERPIIETPIVGSPVTPLPRDSGPKNNARSVKRTTRHSGSSPAAVAPRAQSHTPPRTRRVPVKTRPTRPTPRRKAKRPASPPRPAQPSQPSNPTPAPRPPADVQAPVPTTVCLRPVGGLNCQ